MSRQELNTSTPHTHSFKEITEKITNFPVSLYDDREKNPIYYLRQQSAFFCLFLQSQLVQIHVKPVKYQDRDPLRHDSHIFEYISLILLMPHNLNNCFIINASMLFSRSVSDL